VFTRHVLFKPLVLVKVATLLVCLYFFWNIL
jgi:hypothetical protein